METEPIVDHARRPREAWLLVLAGTAWLGSGMSAGGIGFALAAPPGALLLSTGVAQLLWSGDQRITQFAALGAFGGFVLALPLALFAGLGIGLLLALLSASSFVAAGVASVRQAPQVAGVPRALPTLRLAAKVAIDDLALGGMQVSIAMPRSDDNSRIAREVASARELFEARGWTEKPETFHTNPLPLDAPQIRDRSLRGVRFEHLRFESEYEPRPDEPGRERWLDYRANRTAHAWVLRHSGPERPWLVCINGFMMGTPLVDLGVFDPRIFHEKFGLNLAMPVLPLHGLRRRGRVSGNGFLSGDILDTLHAETQAMWDIRRLLTWVREQGEPAVGVYGLSLGGYTASLLASLDDDLSGVIAGIPLTDIPRAIWLHGPPLLIRNLEQRSLVREDVERVLRPVSPLALEPRVPKSGRAIFAGISDRLVPPDQVRDLHDHWDRPRIAWYPGGHCSFLLEPAARGCIRGALDDAGLLR